MVLGIFRDRKGSFPEWRPKARGTQGREGGWLCWFLGVTFIVLLVIGGTVLNSCFHSKQDKLDAIIATVRNHECEVKTIRLLLFLSFYLHE